MPRTIINLHTYPWPNRCVRQGCMRRPHHAIVETGLDETGRQTQTLRPLCTMCKDLFLAEVEKRRRDYREGMLDS